MLVVIIIYGLKRNLYYPCVANKVGNIKQLMVFWNVDEFGVLHYNNRVIVQIIDFLISVVGEMQNMWGNKHDYLGMDMDF